MNSCKHKVIAFEPEGLFDIGDILKDEGIGEHPLDTMLKELYIINREWVRISHFAPIFPLSTEITELLAIRAPNKEIYPIFSVDVISDSRIESFEQLGLGKIGLKGLCMGKYPGLIIVLNLEAGPFST